MVLTYGGILLREYEDIYTNETVFCDLYTAEDLYTNKDVIVQAILIDVFGACGLGANLLLLVILYHPKMKSSFNVLLRQLVFSDTLIIISIVLMEGVARVIYKFYKTLDDYFFNIFLYIFGMIPYFAQTTSTYLIVALTIERFLVISKPLQARTQYSVYKTRIVVLVIFLFSISFNLPLVLFKNEIASCGNRLTNETRYFLRKQRYNVYFDMYYMSMLYPIFMFVLPIFGLIISNISLYKAVQKSNLIPKSLTYQEYRDRKLTCTLCSEVTVFVICSSVQPLDYFLKDLFGTRVRKYFWMVNTFMCLLHSCLHLFIYVRYDDKFRDILYKLFRLKQCRQLNACFNRV